MVLNRRITREHIEKVFDSFDSFGRGQIRASELVELAAVFAHFLDVAPNALYSELAGATTVDKEKAVNHVWSHIVGAASGKEATTLYDVLSSDTQPGPADSLSIVGARFGANPKHATHPDGAKIDPLLLSVATRCTGERASAKSVADRVLLVQNAAGVLFPGRPAEECLHREEWEDLSIAAQLLTPGGSKRMWKQLYQVTRSEATTEIPPTH